MRVYRSIGIGSYNEEQAKNFTDSIKLGDVIPIAKEGAFQSTSVGTRYPVARSSPHSIMFEINATEGAPIGDITQGGGTAREAELLLPRNARFRVVGIQHNVQFGDVPKSSVWKNDNLRTVIQVEQVPEDTFITASAIYLEELETFHGNHDQSTHGNWADPEHAKLVETERLEKHYGRKSEAPEMGGVQWAFEGGSEPITAAAEDILEGYAFDPSDRYRDYDRQSYEAAEAILHTLEDPKSTNDVTLYSGHRRFAEDVNEQIRTGKVSFPLVATSNDRPLAVAYSGKGTKDSPAVVYEFPKGAAQSAWYRYNEHIATGDYKITRHIWNDDKTRVTIRLEQEGRVQVPPPMPPYEEDFHALTREEFYNKCNLPENGQFGPKGACGGDADAEPPILDKSSENPKYKKVKPATRKPGGKYGTKEHQAVMTADKKGGTKTKGSKAEIAAARALANRKVKDAPTPTRDQVIKAREALRKHQEGGRAGGDSRGNVFDRRNGRLNLFDEFGGFSRGYIVDPETGIKMHWADSREYIPNPKTGELEYNADHVHNPHGYPVLERGKIFVARQGGGYQQENLVPESFQSNRSRGDTAIRRENEGTEFATRRRFADYLRERERRLNASR